MPQCKEIVFRLVGPGATAGCMPERLSRGGWPALNVVHSAGERDLTVWRDLESALLNGAVALGDRVLERGARMIRSESP